VAIAGLLLIAGIAAIALTGDDRQERRGRRGADRPRETPAKVVPTTEGFPVDVPTATAAFHEAIRIGVAEGQLQEELGANVLEEVDKATEEYTKGELDKALEHLANAYTELHAGVAEGTVASEATADDLSRGLEIIRIAMTESPVVVETPEEEPEEESDEGGDSGPGNSENAPGQMKKEEEDD
jgi:hypothetical protein